MKKQFLSLLLTLCMVSVLFPATALAATEYDIWVGSTQVTGVNASNVLNDGRTVSFDAATSMLTLNNANITSSAGTYRNIMIVFDYRQLFDDQPWVGIIA